MAACILSSGQNGNSIGYHKTVSGSYQNDWLKSNNSQPCPQDTALIVKAFGLGSLLPLIKE